MTPAVDGREASDALLNRIAIYVHWPFCRSKCPYCDFNSTAADVVDQHRWRRALLAELACWAEETRDRTAVSVFFGGGTPSLMDPQTVADVVAAVHRHWRVTDDLEVTLEANPNSVERDRFGALRDAGVNRMSIGVQSFDNRILAFLGRSHDADEARRAVETAQRSVPRVSLDLIYAWPGQSLAHWRRELEAALAVAGEHVSPYQLTIEPGTPFHRQGVRGADEDPAADLYDLTDEVLSAAGLDAYEISNHARSGAACRHNVFVWRGGDYIGVGPGAHGRLRRQGRTFATRQHRRADRWLAAVETAGHGGTRRAPLSADARVEELLLLGLRLTSGIDRRDFRALTGREIEEAVEPVALRRLKSAGLVALDDVGLRVTRGGRLLLDTISGALLAGAMNGKDQRKQEGEGGRRSPSMPSDRAVPDQKPVGA
ncbi:MAG: coproporphyrinogen III oxidase [Rhodospirillales bacterium]|nr:coproporphyrinogen III oxidase [Rhodospirillales bacterium]